MTAIETPERTQYLSFSVAGADCAVPIVHVREILEFEDVTRVPSVPPSIRGVINLRGSVVPVIDLALKLGLGETRPTPRTCILVAETVLDGHPAAVGVLADAVSEVLELAPGEVREPPPFGAAARTDFLLGMGSVGKGLVLLLDLDRIIAADEREIAGDHARRAASNGDGAPGAAIQS